MGEDECWETAGDEVAWCCESDADEHPTRSATVASASVARICSIGLPPLGMLTLSRGVRTSSSAAVRASVHADAGASVGRHDVSVAGTQEQRSRQDPVVSARAVVAERYPEAVQAWLSGSVVLGGSTSTSDLDITVLRDAGEARRESLTFQGWPVEMFVHTSATIRWFVAKDLARRKPTMARLVATGIPLLPGPAGEELRQECAEVLASGPGPVPDAEMDVMRYHLTDQVDDLATIDSGPVGDAIAVEVWRLTAELLLASRAAWTGGAKWLIREIETLDTQLGTDFATRLHAGLGAALRGDPAPLSSLAEEALAHVGGPLWSGFSLVASDASAPNGG